MPEKLVVPPIKPDTLYFYDKKKSLETVNMIKEKLCGKIKGRKCADGSEQKI